jgi:hypothetical protein
LCGAKFEIWEAAEPLRPESPDDDTLLLNLGLNVGFKGDLLDAEEILHL